MKFLSLLIILQLVMASCSIFNNEENKIICEAEELSFKICTAEESITFSNESEEIYGQEYIFEVLKTNVVFSNKIGRDVQLYTTCGTNTLFRPVSLEQNIGIGFKNVSSINCGSILGELVLIEDCKSFSTSVNLSRNNINLEKLKVALGSYLMFVK